MSLGLLTRGYIVPAIAAVGGGGSETPPVPVPSPFEPGDTEYVDHVEEMLSRLVYQLARIK